MGRNKISKKKRFYETDEFKQQRDEWYAKLADEGFEDIEMTDPKTGELSTRFLRGNISSVVSIHNNPELDSKSSPTAGGFEKFRITPKMRDAIRASRIVEKLLDDPELSWDQKMACAMFAEGFDQQEIANDMGTSRRRVRRLVLPLRDAMKGKDWEFDEE
jgi:hypothetical protein